MLGKSGGPPTASQLTGSMTLSLGAVLGGRPRVSLTCL